MANVDLLRGRIRRFVSTERIGLVIGSATVIGAVVVGVVMGGPALLGLVGVLIAGGALLVMAWRNRNDRVVGSSVGGVLVTFAVTTLAVLVAIQLVPYGRSHTNPAVVAEPEWASPQTREFMVNSCFGCHSNEVVWPWYSNIAPISWVVTIHVDDGRDNVNYSEFTINSGDADETIEVIREGSMPPSYYTLFGLHPEAKLSDAEIDLLIAGLLQTPGMDEADDD